MTERMVKAVATVEEYAAAGLIEVRKGHLEITEAGIERCRGGAK